MAFINSTDIMQLWQYRISEFKLFIIAEYDSIALPNFTTSTFTILKSPFIFFKNTVSNAPTYHCSYHFLN